MRCTTFQDGSNWSILESVCELRTTPSSVKIARATSCQWLQRCTVKSRWRSRHWRQEVDDWRSTKKHLGHPRDTVARQSDWALFTLGRNSSQFCSQSLFPLLRRSSQIITCKIVFFAINSLISQVLSHSARQTRLLWPLKPNHYLRQRSVFIWRNS
jgi:hypothetical protein